MSQSASSVASGAATSSLPILVSVDAVMALRTASCPPGPASSAIAPAIGSPDSTAGAAPSRSRNDCSARSQSVWTCAGSSGKMPRLISLQSMRS